MDTAKVDAIISKHNGDATALLAIMQDIQAEENYLPRDAVEYVAKNWRFRFPEFIPWRLSLSRFISNPAANTSVRFAWELPVTYVALSDWLNSSKEIWMLNPVGQLKTACLPLKR